MKRTEQPTLPAIGGTSLLVIFAVLCLSVFSLLSLRTVLAEKQASDAAARAIDAYYQADLEAQTIFARLRAGEAVSSVTVAGDRYHFACPISQQQTLEVALQKQGTDWAILQWQAVAHTEAPDQTLPVWGGY